MQISGRNLPGQRSFHNVLALALMSAVLIILQGCSGSSSPNYPTPNTQNPNPGVTLEQIKITPANPVLLLSQARQLFATGLYSDGSSIDISQQVNWDVTAGTAGSTNPVAVSAKGVASGQAIGSGVITATAGSVTGLIQVVVTTNGFSSSVVSVLPVPYKATEIDLAYFPVQTQIQGAYAVQAVNLDAEHFSNVLPVPVALRASIPMPADFVPNATAANQSTARLAVISYTSPNVQIIDASNDPLDLSSNTLIATFAAPVTQSVTINGISCMICAAVVNPTNNQLILSTAQGYYSMNMTTGVFTAMPFSPSPMPSASISLNPAAAQPYILSATPAAGAFQILNLTTNAVTTYNGVTPAPASTAIDLVTDYAAITDGSTSAVVLADLTNPQSAQTSLAQPLGTCSGSPLLNMAALGVSASSTPANALHTLFTSETGGTCVGFQFWPNAPLQGGISQASSGINYLYNPMPPTPDGNPFVNGNDPNSIATFTSVVDQKNYGVLVGSNQQWVAKINFNTVAGNIFNPSPLPAGALVEQGFFLADGAGPQFPVRYFPTPLANFILSTNSVDFGSVAVGTLSPAVVVNLTNIGTGSLSPQIGIQGANAGDFLLDTTCSFTLLTQSSCAISVTFTPTATGARSAAITVTNSGEPAQTVQLTGTGS
jgi:hypothetical protein